MASLSLRVKHHFLQTALPFGRVPYLPKRPVFCLQIASIVRSIQYSSYTIGKADIIPIHCAISLKIPVYYLAQTGRLSSRLICSRQKDAMN